MIERRLRRTKTGRISRIYPTAVVKEFVRNEIPALRRRPLEEALERVSPAERATIGSAIRRLRETPGAARSWVRLRVPQHICKTGV